MKIDRLICILSILLQRNKVTSQELVEKFEVSRRTILRDIESLNMAGIEGYFDYVMPHSHSGCPDATDSCLQDPRICVII